MRSPKHDVSRIVHNLNIECDTLWCNAIVCDVLHMQASACRCVGYFPVCSYGSVENNT